MLAGAKVGFAQVVVEGGADGSWIATAPNVALGDIDSTSVRTFHGGSLASSGQLFMLGGHAGASAQVGRRWAVPMLTIGLSGAAGPSERVNVPADGTLVQLKPWTAWQLMFLRPGVETRVTLGKWLLSASLRGGVSTWWMGVDVAAGASGGPHTAHALSGAGRRCLRPGHVGRHRRSGTAHDARLTQQGIRWVVYVVEDLDDTDAEEDDLHKTMLAYQQSGVALYLVDLAWAADLQRPARIDDALASHQLKVRLRRTLVDYPAFYARSQGGFGGPRLAPSPFIRHSRFYTIHGPHYRGGGGIGRHGGAGAERQT